MFGHQPTAEQQHAIDVATQFMTDRDERSLMILRGAAGTGKTTLAASVVKAMTAAGQKLLLLAPTGRAAKVLSIYAGVQAYTIHRRIYRQKSIDGDFGLNFNSAQDTLVVVDEASMLANSSQSGVTPFRYGQLLDDLVEFVYSGRNCRLMLIGDAAQLPPVGESDSPALRSDVMRAYSMKVYEASLSEVLRQSLDSGILWNATLIRHMLSSGECAVPKIRLRGFADIVAVPGDELIETLATSYSRAGLDETIVVTRSNKRANIYNQGIRRTVLDRDDELCRGDMLMIVKNNYYWGSQEERALEALRPSMTASPQKDSMPSALNYPPSALNYPPSALNSKKGGAFLANGDRARVERVRNVRELYGFRFADVIMTMPDYDARELTATVLLDTLGSEAPALTSEQQERLRNAVMDDYSDITQKTERLKRVRDDRYYNALQVKFAYAVTCHKAQGGQWAHVYVDQGYITDDMLTPDYLRWLYTAFTRATEKLFLVNWRSEE